MHLDPIMPIFFTIALASLVIGFFLRKLKQPHVVSYIIVGLILGPFGFSLFQDVQVVQHFGSLGVVMLLFFIGMEVSPEKLIAQWKLAIFGTILQLAFGFLVIALIGKYFNWTLSRIVLMTFVITLSSTAVVLKLFQEWGQLDTKVGNDVLGILLVQDFAVVPMLLTVSFMSDVDTDSFVLLKQLIGAFCLLGLSGWAVTRKRKQRTLPAFIQQDSELQLFAALTLCFGLALLSGWLELSTALGAFVAGIVIGQNYNIHWIIEKLGSLRDLFVALFFLSIGLLIDLNFVKENIDLLLMLLFAVMAVNTVINGLILKMFGRSWKHSIYGGVVLSQVGEFSFIIAAVGLSSGLIMDYAYQLTIALIAFSLMISPAYIALARKIGFSSE